MCDVHQGYYGGAGVPDEIVFSAMQFAMEKHEKQRRKYTGNPYFDHLSEVAGIVASVAWRHPDPKIVIATAWLHDVREDQGVSEEELTSLFGHEIAAGVTLLSDLEGPEFGNRAKRKAASRLRLGSAPAWIQDIKTADLISNTSSIVMHDPNFAAVYLGEKDLLLNAMTKADSRLVSIASRIIETNFHDSMPAVRHGI